MNMNVKIQYGLDIESGKIRHISEVESGEKANCKCIECGNILIARKGKIQKHHFQHKSNKKCNGGNPETVLHLIGKEIIKENNRVLLFKTKYFDYYKVELEKKINDYKPDAVVTNNQNESWLVEIAVSHFIDKEKKEKIQRDKKNCIEITLQQDLIFENREKIKYEVLQNPENRKIINDVNGLFDKSKEKNNTNWLLYAIIISGLFFFKKQIKKILKGLLVNL